MKKLLALFIVLVIVVGCVAQSAQRQQTVEVSGQPPVVMVLLDPTLEPFAAAWKVEIARRFPHAVAVFVHGSDPALGVWTSATFPYRRNPKAVMKEIMAVYPDRTPVLLSCNPGHLKLGMPGVYYSPSDAWLIPDRAIKGMDDLMARAKMSALIPTSFPATGPSTAPTTAPATMPSYSLPSFDFTFPNIPVRSFLLPLPAEPKITRWQDDPDTVGNIFEFIKDD